MMKKKPYSSVVLKEVVPFSKDAPVYPSKDIGAEPDVPGGQATSVLGPQYAFPGGYPSLSGAPTDAAMNLLSNAGNVGFDIRNPEHVKELVYVLTTTRLG